MRKANLLSTLFFAISVCFLLSPHAAFSAGYTQKWLRAYHVSGAESAYGYKIISGEANMFYVIGPVSHVDSAYDLVYLILKYS